MFKFSSYSVLNVTATCDGVPVSGYWEGDDVLTITPHADDGTLMVGADGSGLFSQSADRGADITLRLQHVSPTHSLLLARRKLQRAGRFFGMPFTFLDTASGAGGVCATAFIMRAPTSSIGTNAVAQEWVLTTNFWEDSVPALAGAVL